MEGHTYDALTVYDCERPCIQQRDVLISQEGSDCSFLPEYPQNTFGTLVLTLEWPELMLPRGRIISSLISGAKAGTWSPLFISPEEVEPPLDLLRFRVTLDRYARIQISNPINTPSSIHFNVPSVKAVLSALLEQAGFGEFRDAHHSQYQRVFIERSGSLESACKLLQSSPYREFFKLMSNNNSNDQLPGQVPKALMRRVLPQSELWRKLQGEDLPGATEDYLKSCASKLPDQAIHLITHELLERGFQLHCSQCSSTDWYRAEEVGQRFRCHRCYKKQWLESNEPWLYKLPEVIFQAFELDADVPLLALHHLQKKSRQNFDYGLDSEVLINNRPKNVDFSCLSDGLLYIGEAKSNSDIDQAQFESYQDFLGKVPIDGMVFATSKPDWAPATKARIESLMLTFKGNVIVLTQTQLFEQQHPVDSG